MRAMWTVALAAVSVGALAQSSRIGNNPPKLVVVISVDQFRADYIERFNSYFLPKRSKAGIGGLKFLMETGAHYLDAHHNHLPTATGPGHATLLTGSEPAFNGIVGNEWFDRESNKSMYCVDDASVKTVGGSGGPMSPRNLKVTTVGDELKMATNGRAKVVGISFKDRAAILMAGHAADNVIWFDAKNGNWQSSTFYQPSGNLAKWVTDFNAEQRPAKALTQTWEPMLPADAYAITRKAPFEKAAANGLPFSHPLGPTGFGTFTTSAQGQDYLFQTVERAVDEEKLGQHDVPDMLVFNLATNDYVGHRYGPNSPEVLDITIATDRYLSRFFNKLDKTVPGGIDNVAIVLTADHGVVPIPEEAREVYRTGATRLIEKSVTTAVNQALNAKYGEAKWLLGDGLYEEYLYLDRTIISGKGLDLRAVQRVAATAAASVTGVYDAYSVQDITHGEFADLPFKNIISNSIHPRLSGDVVVLNDPGSYVGGGTGTGHGAVWAYDTHVPILFRAKGVKAGKYRDRVYTADIASTICHLIGVEYPTGNVGKPLPGMGQ